MSEWVSELEENWYDTTHLNNFKVGFETKPHVRCYFYAGRAWKLIKKTVTVAKSDNLVYTLRQRYPEPRGDSVTSMR